jgi:hypothetical protein
MYIPSLIPLVFFLFGTKKREQITEVSVKEENEVILDRRTEVIGIMEFLQKGKKYVSSKMKHKSTQEQIVKWH